jgi:hypothetical protein
MGEGSGVTFQAWRGLVGWFKTRGLDNPTTGDFDKVVD